MCQMESLGPRLTGSKGLASCPSYSIPFWKLLRKSVSKLFLSFWKALFFPHGSGVGEGWELQVGRQEVVWGGTLGAPPLPRWPADLEVWVESPPEGTTAKLPPTARGKPPGDCKAEGIQGKLPRTRCVHSWPDGRLPPAAAFQGPFDPRHFAK